MKNADIAHLFESIAYFLEVKDDNPFKIRAYRTAALSIKNLGEAIEAVAAEGRLEEIPGVGKDLAAKIMEFLATGTMKHYEELKTETPEAVIDMMSVPGLGPKTAMLLYDKLKIRNIDELERKAKAHKVSGLPGIGDKTEENILKGISLVKRRAGTMTLKEALDAARDIIPRMKKLAAVKRIDAAGSLRRMKEAVRDIDILTVSKDPSSVMDAFVRLPMAKEVISKGNTKSEIVRDDGVQVDLRVVEPESYGAALVYFTGSKAHNVHIRQLAKKIGLKVNEYGVFRMKDGRRIAGRSEEEVDGALKMAFVPPELREDRGEVDVALEGKLPRLVDKRDIKGDLHVHSAWSDGDSQIEEIVRACIKKAYRYVVIADHSKGLKVAGGLSEKEARSKLKEIKTINGKLKGFRILSGAEVEIAEDGSIDYSDDVLKSFDIVIAAIHSGFKQPKEKLTRRILRAMDNRYVHIIAHPTGRHMGVRDPGDIDLEAVFRNAAATNTALEINAYPERLDLNDINARAARDAGAKIAIGTDAHTMEHLDSMELGLAVARRAWLTKGDLLNALSPDELLKSVRK